MKIIDAHAHLWLNQNTVVDGKKVETLTGGRSFFFDEIRQMMPPYILDGKNTAEILLSNMDYAQVSAAVITQEYIDGNQNEYLQETALRYPDRFLCCGLIDARKENYFQDSERCIEQGFQAMKLPAGRLIMQDKRILLTEKMMMDVFSLMESKNIILSIDLADGALQVPEMEEVIRTFPNLKIAIGHFGMVNVKDWQEQIKLAGHSNVMIESGGITWLFHQEFYPYPSAIKAIRRAIDLVGIDKLMWGSDYPRTMTAITYRMSYDFILKTNKLTGQEKSKFLGENAERFYGFKNLKELPYIKNMVE